MSAVRDRLTGRYGNAPWILDHLDYPHDYCLIWPFPRHKSGYAHFNHVPVHRIMCEHANGPAPSPKHHAAHSCGRGAEGCVNPKHVRWRTNSENQLERYRHSGLTPRRKLTPEQVDEIRAMKGREQVQITADRYGVTEINVRQIQAGKLWTSHPRQRVFSADEVRSIRAQYLKTSQSVLGRQFGVSAGVIGKIQLRQTYRYVDDRPQSGGAE